MQRLFDTLRRSTWLVSLALFVMAWHPPPVIATSAEPVHSLATGETLSHGFTLQVAAFSDQRQADALATRLEGAWIEEVRKGSGNIYRVNYRRFDERSAAVRAQWQLEDLGYKSFIQQLYA